MEEKERLQVDPGLSVQSLVNSKYYFRERERNYYRLLIDFQLCQVSSSGSNNCSHNSRTKSEAPRNTDWREWHSFSYHSPLWQEYHWAKSRRSAFSCLLKLRSFHKQKRKKKNKHTQTQKNPKPNQLHPTKKNKPQKTQNQPNPTPPPPKQQSQKKQPNLKKPTCIILKYEVIQEYGFF